LYHLPDDAAVVGTVEGETVRASVMGASAYSQDCRWMPSSMCILRHSADQRHRVSRPIETILDESGVVCVIVVCGS